MADTRIIKETGEPIAAYRKRKREERKAKGQCLHCSEPRLEGVQFCQKHAEGARASYRKYINKKPREKRRETLAEWRDKNRVKGNCTKCIDPAIPGKACCLVHLTENQGITRARRKQLEIKARKGYCAVCGVKPKLPKAKRCEPCYFKDVSRRHLGTNKQGEMIQRLWQASNGICKYTGQIIVLGRNAHLDHIIPRCRGGTNDENNLQWISADANRLKHIYSEEELLVILDCIANHRLRSR